MWIGSTHRPSPGQQVTAASSGKRCACACYLPPSRRVSSALDRWRTGRMQEGTGIVCGARGGITLVNVGRFDTVQQAQNITPLKNYGSVFNGLGGEQESEGWGEGTGRAETAEQRDQCRNEMIKQDSRSSIDASLTPDVRDKEEFNFRGGRSEIVERVNSTDHA
ncbi:hypothetical protein LSAT2_009548 [Lamellibrachia satsuma]|nr:hypothetical protein LSAT2_009548 [Lamellibrachia satsuma]